MEKILYNNEVDFNLVDKIKKEKFKFIKNLKNDDRSKVMLIEIDGNKYVYKIPKEKNSRLWQRVISLVRGSESKREYENYLKIKKNGFKGPIPVMYWEKKIFGVCVDSFLVSSYLSGKPATQKNLETVEKELKKIHARGFLHGDSQLNNFMVENNEVYLIDAKLMKNRYGKAGETYEFIYLEESCYKNIDVYDKSTLSYKLAKGLNNYLHWIGKMKKAIRGKGKIN